MAISLGPFKYPVPGAIPGEYLITGFDAALSVESDLFGDYYDGTIFRLFVQQGDTRQEASPSFFGSITALLDEGNNPRGKMAIPSLSGEGGQDSWEIDLSVTYGTGSIYYPVAHGSWFYSTNINKTILYLYGDDLTYWEDLGLVAGAECYYLPEP